MIYLRRLFYSFAITLGLGSASLAGDTRPNIILFLADDMGQGDTSAYQDFTGNASAEQVHTPTMEKLAASGIRFTDGHSPAAYCNPTRISLLRGGRTVSRAEDFGTALPSMLNRSGYRTYGVGKWHVFFERGSDYLASSPIKLCALDFGFDHYTGTQHNITKSPAYHIDRAYQRYIPETKSLVPNETKEAPGYGKPGGPHEPISQQLWVNAARDYMDEHASDGGHANKPFFLYYPSHANHNQLLPASDLDGIPVKGACKTSDGQPLSTDRDSLRLDRSEMVYENDVAISLLLKWLNETDDPRNPGEKMVANTLFIFSSDNGANDDFGRPANGRLSGNKGSIEEGGHREPFIVSWPQSAPAGVTSSAPISLIDMFATLAAVAKEPLAAGEGPDSCNLLELFLDPANPKPRPKGLYAAQSLRPDHCMIREGDFKIVWETTHPPKFTALYDLGRDLAEEENLLGNSDFEEVEKSLKMQVRDFLKSGPAPSGGGKQKPKKKKEKEPKAKSTKTISSQPNIIFVLADDLGYGDLECYNAESKIPTPNLNRLAREGMRFTDAHSGAAVCSPTRYGLLTGTHFLRRPGWIEGMTNQCLIDDEQVTVAEFLQEQGYHTAAFGKWHLGQTWFNKDGTPRGPSLDTDYTRPTEGGPNDHGFDYFLGMNGTAVGAPLSMMENRLVQEIPTEKGPKKGRPMAKGHQLDEVMPRTTKGVLSYIDESAEQRPGQPFFIYYALTAVHTPIVPAKQYLGKSEASDYGDFVCQIDDAMGKIQKRLVKHGLLKDTIVIFSSDNGSHGRASAEPGNGIGSVMKKFGHKANGDWSGVKGDGYEGGHRVPLIVRWTKHISAGSTCDELVTLEDFMATCADLVDKELPADSARDSFSFLPHIENATATADGRSYAVFCTFNGQPVVRKGPWVLLPFEGTGGPYGKHQPSSEADKKGQLYNLADDPQQMTNLWAKHPERVHELTELLAEHERQGHSVGLKR